MSSNTGPNVFTTTEWLECQRLAQYAVSKVRAKYRLTEEGAEDLISDGTIAAIAALKTWDPKKGKKSTWLLRRINGEVIDQFNKLNHGGLTGACNAITVGSLAPGGVTDDNHPEEYCEDDDPGSYYYNVLEADEDVESDATALSIALAVERLPKGDRELIEAYYGVGSVVGTKSLRRLGNEYGVSGEAVRLRLNKIISSLSN